MRAESVRENYNWDEGESERELKLGEGVSEREWSVCRVCERTNAGVKG